MKEEPLLLLSDLQKLINQVVLIDYTIIILGGNEMVNRKLKKCASLFLVMSMAVSMLAGCGSKNATEEASSTSDAVEATVDDSAEVKKITYFTPKVPSDDVLAIFQELAEEYKAEGHNIEFVLETADTDGYDQKLRAMATANELPELFDVDGDSFCQELADAGMVVDMQAFLEEIGAIDNFIGASLDYIRLDDGSLYGIPWEFTTDMFWYDKDVYEKYNLEVPKTFDDLLENCRILKENGETPIIVDGADGWFYLRYLAMIPFRETGNDFVYALKSGDAKMSDATGMETLQFLQDIGQYFQPGCTSTDYSTSLELFLDGQGVMYTAGTGLLDSFMKANEEGKNFDYFYMPLTDNAVTSANEYWVFGGLGMAANSATWDDDVKEFVEYLVKNFSVKYAQRGHFPAQNVEVDLDNMDDLYVRIANDNENIGDVYTRPWDVVLPDNVTTVFNDNIASVALGQMKPEDMAALVDEELEK